MSTERPGGRQADGTTDGLPDEPDDRTLLRAHLDGDPEAFGRLFTRHRDRLDMHWSNDNMRDRATLAHHLGRNRAKDTTLDYGVC